MHKFCFVLWVHCDFDLMIFLEREVKEQEDGVVVGVGRPLAEQLLSALISTEKVHAAAKSTLSKVQIPCCRKGQSPTTLSEVDVVQNPTLSKKKKSKSGGNLTRSGVRVRGIGLVWTSALTRSDRDQHQTRSRTRHRNLTRLVSHVLLTSLMPRPAHNSALRRSALENVSGVSDDLFVLTLDTSRGPTQIYTYASGCTAEVHSFPS